MFWALKLSLANLRRQWLQSCLMMLGLALGCAVMIAVDLANQSASRSFEISTRSLTGKATHRIVSLAGAGVPQSVYLRLRREFAQIPAAPGIRARLRLPQLQNQSVELLGLDPLAEAAFHPQLAFLQPRQPGQPKQTALKSPELDWGQFISRADMVLVPESLQLSGLSSLDLQPAGQTGLFKAEVLGVIRHQDPGLQSALQNTLLADIGTAQQILGQPGRLSQIDLILPAHSESLLQRLRQSLPPGLDLIPADSQAQHLQKMSKAFALNLSALSLLALVVGMFLVYNTMSFSVLRRRPEIGTLRTLGVSRREILGLILSESLILALFGSLLGIALGVALGKGLLHLVVQTINDLYYRLEVTQLQLEPLSLIKGLLGSLGAALLASLLPALEAMLSPPAGVLRSSLLEERLQRYLGPLALSGLGLMLLGAGLLWLPGPLWFSFACFLLVVLGACLGLPWLIRLSMDALARVLPPLVRLAPRQLGRSLSRSAVAMAALMVAVAVVISMSIMITSFRQSVLDWLERTLSADIYVSSNQGDVRVVLSPDLLRRLRAQPAVERAESSRQSSILMPDRGYVQLWALSADLAARRRYLWLNGSEADLWRRLDQGAVLVSEPYANRYGLKHQAGQSVSLPTTQGSQRFEIIGIFQDYTSDQGMILMSEHLWQRHWSERHFSSIALRLKPGFELESSLQELRQGFAQEQLEFKSHRALKQGAIEVFERTFAITGALRLLAILVACLGIFSALMAMLIERRRSFGILRALGMGSGELMLQILLESGLMGLFAGLCALPLGLLLAEFLIQVINLRSFGWSMDLLLRPADLLQGLLLALGAALLAGIWPALRTIRERPAGSIRWE